MADTYTGVSLWDLITSAGLVTTPSIKNDVLGKYVVAVGSDGYEAVFSLGEIDPMFGDQQDLVVYSDIDGQLGPDGQDGFARLVAPAIQPEAVTSPTLSDLRSTTPVYPSRAASPCSP